MRLFAPNRLAPSRTAAGPGVSGSGVPAVAPQPRRRRAPSTGIDRGGHQATEASTCAASHRRHRGVRYHLGGRIRRAGDPLVLLPGHREDPAQLPTEEGRRRLQRLAPQHPPHLRGGDLRRRPRHASTQIASGNGPDIVGPVGVGGAEAFHGQWLDLAPLIEETGYDVAQYDPGAVDFYKTGGEGQTGLPFAIYPSMIWYKARASSRAGLEPPPHSYGDPYVWPDGAEAEWNYDTVRELALLLTVDANGLDATQDGFDPENIVQYGFEPQRDDLRGLGAYFGAGSLAADDGTTVQIPDAWADGWKYFYDGMWGTTPS